ASTGIITTVAGGGTGCAGQVDSVGDGCLATQAILSITTNAGGSVALDNMGNLYIADTQNNRIRQVTLSTGIITAVAGTGTAGYSGDGGNPTLAQVKHPYGLSVTDAGDIYIADTDNNRIREVITSTDTITTVAGTGTAGYGGDGGAATLAQLHGPRGVAA